MLLVPSHPSPAFRVSECVVLLCLGLVASQNEIFATPGAVCGAVLDELMGKFFTVARGIVSDEVVAIVQNLIRYDVYLG